MNYAKLIDGNLVYAPCKLTVGNYVVYNPTPEMLTDAGYKPVVYTEPPAVAEGYVAVAGWEETCENITQTWSVELLPVSEEQALTRYINEWTDHQDETLADAAETLIKTFMEV